MTSSLVDPQLQAFWDSDPSLLTAPVETPGHKRSREKLALEIGVGMLITITLVRAALRKRHAETNEAAGTAREVWRLQVPRWVEMMTPIILEAYRANRVAPELTAEQAATLAAQYAASIGDYVGDTSTAALDGAMQLQVGAGVDSRTAWQRSAAAFGLDAREMRGYLGAVMLASEKAPGVIVTPAAEAFIDKATTARAELFGTSESWTAMETGKALGWLYLQRLGRLPADAMREWDTAESESTCALCNSLHQVQVALDEPFQVPGAKLWAPQAHPKCQCHIKLVLPEEVEKAYDPSEPRDTEGQWAAVAKPKTKPVREAERDPAMDTLMDAARAQAAEKVETEEKVEPLFKPASLFQPKPVFKPKSPFAPKAAFAPTAPAGPLFAPHRLDESPFAARERGRSAARERQRGYHRRIVVLPPAPAPRPGPRRERLYYLAADRVNAVTSGELGKIYNHDEDIDFSPAQADANFRLRATHMSPWQALDTDHIYLRRGMDPTVDREAVTRAWQDVLPTAVKVWHVVMADPDKYLLQLEDDDMQTIAEQSGLYSPDPRRPDVVSGVDLKNEIRRAAAANRRGFGPEDSSLYQAFGDYMTWQRPEMVGELGEGLSNKIEDYRTVGVYLADNPVDQALVFDRSEARRQDRQKDHVLPTGNYAVAERTYRSAIRDDGFGVQPLRIGLQEARMMPYHSDGRRWEMVTD